MDYEQIPFKCKYFHEYGHFSKSWPKKPEKSNPEENPEEGWNIASKRKGARAAPSPSQTTSEKNAVRNKFQVLADEEKEEGEFVVGEETNTLQEVEAPNITLVASATIPQNSKNFGGPSFVLD